MKTVGFNVTRNTAKSGVILSLFPLQSPPIALLPSSKAGRLVTGTYIQLKTGLAFLPVRAIHSVGPSFSGQAHVFQSVDVPPVEIPTPGSKKQMEVPEGLRQRWKPFGWSKVMYTL